VAVELLLRALTLPVDAASDATVPGVKVAADPRRLPPPNAAAADAEAEAEPALEGRRMVSRLL
jgi:hypothetical protein